MHHGTGQAHHMGYSLTSWVVKKTTDRVQLSYTFLACVYIFDIAPHSIHNSVVFMPIGTACWGGKVHLRPPTSNEEYPLSCGQVRVREILDREGGARLVVHFYQSVVY